MSKISNKIRTLRSRVRALEREHDEHVVYVSALESQGRAELARLASQVHAAAPMAPVTTAVQRPASDARSAALSASDVSWLARTLRNGARVAGHNVTLTLSATDARTIAARLDAASGGDTFARLAALVG